MPKANPKISPRTQQSESDLTHSQLSGIESPDKNCENAQDDLGLCCPCLL